MPPPLFVPYAQVLPPDSSTVFMPSLRWALRALSAWNLFLLVLCLVLRLFFPPSTFSWRFPFWPLQPLARTIQRNSNALTLLLRAHCWGTSTWVPGPPRYRESFNLQIRNPSFSPCPLRPLPLPLPLWISMDSATSRAEDFELRFCPKSESSHSESRWDSLWSSLIHKLSQIYSESSAGSNLFNQIPSNMIQ